MNASNNALRGTPAELAGRVTLNGHTLGQPEISFLTRLGDGTFAKKVGTAKKGGGRGGKPATIWEFKPKASMNFDIVEQAVAETGKIATSIKSAASDEQPITRKNLEEVIVRAVAEAVSHLSGAQASVQAGAGDEASQ